MYRFIIFTILLGFTFTVFAPANPRKGSAKRDSSVVVTSINITGNRITKDKVVLRELTFAEYDSISVDQIAAVLTKSKENIENTQLFNFVHVNFDTLQNKLAVNIDVEERWYFWPIPIFEYADRNLSAFLKEGDYTRVNVGGYLRVDNFRGMRDQLKLRLVVGYRNQIALQYKTHSLDKNNRHGINSWIYYATNNEIPFITSGNEPMYFKTRSGAARKVFLSEISYQFRPQHYWYHRLTAGHVRSAIADTIALLNPNYFGDGKTSFVFSHLKYELILDKRDSKIFPLAGYYFDAELGRQGLFNSEDLSLWYSQFSARYYLPIVPRLYTGIDIMAKVSSKNNLPYYVNEAVGFRDYIRGFEYYVTNGSTFMINKNSVKFEIMPTRVVNLPLVPQGKFKKAHLALYWSIFGDTGWVKRDNQTHVNNTLEGNFLYGVGTGLNLVAYYDAILRVEYSINKFGESGFFLHFGTPFLND